MQILISIECDTISELYTHFYVIKKEVRQQVKKLKLDVFKDELLILEIQDSNYYGEHRIDVTYGAVAEPIEGGTQCDVAHI